jgi:short-subunit dehydrogenase
MAKRGRGGILLMGSLTGNAGMANVATYGGSKAFAQIFGEALWTELRPHGIDVLVFVVGATDTPARARSGSPNVSGGPLANPDAVAQEGLDNLANGPVYVLPAYTKMFQQLCSSPRGQLTGRSVTPGTQPQNRPAG